MSAKASRTTTEETVRFEVGDQIVIVDLPGEGGIIPEDMSAPQNPYKYSELTTQPGRIS